MFYFLMCLDQNSTLQVQEMKTNSSHGILFFCLAVVVTNEKY